jgi:hypothetical protein
VPFGGNEYGLKLLPIARQIKTFTERLEDDGALAAIRNEVAEAEVVVFLGFAFYEQNMELINPSSQTKAKRVFATAYGISPSDCEVVKKEILQKFDRKPQHLKIELRNSLKCVDLFREYSRSLTSA